MTRAAIPLTVIGGFLGAGKTTLLNRLLTETSGRRFAVLVNDFGDIAIDGALVAEHGGDTITFANGCLCCTIGDSLLQTLNQLLARPMPPEHIVVEASGVADPRQIADVGTLHPALQRDLTIVLVDGETIRERAEDARLQETVGSQLDSAEVLVLNKIDLIGEAQCSALRAWLAQRAPAAAIMESVQARLPLGLLFGAASDRAASAQIGHGAGHDHGAQFRSLTLRLERPVHLDRLRDALAALPRPVLRVKGFVRTGDETFLVQRAGRRLQIEKWRRAETPPPACLVFIGLPEMPDEAWFEETFQSSLTN